MRQFILQNQTVKNNLITLEGKDFRYLRQVLRVKTGDMVNVRLASGILCDSTVAKIDDKAHKIILQIAGETFSQNSHSDGENDFSSCSANPTQLANDFSNLTEIGGTEYILFQFLPRPQKFEQIVRQSTECGVSTIVPILGEYSEKSSAVILEGSKKERIEKIIREARQQSGSPIQTKVLPPTTLEKACELWQENIKSLSENEKSLALVLSERKEPEHSILNILKRTAENGQKNPFLIKKVAVAVGSEGGISPQEVDFLQKNQFEAIHFDVNILRCETAALYGIAAIQSAISGLKMLQKNHLE